MLAATSSGVTKSGRKRKTQNVLDGVYLSDYEQETKSVVIRVADSKRLDEWTDVTLSLGLLEDFVKQKQLETAKEIEKCAGFEIAGSMESITSKHIYFGDQLLIVNEDLNWKTTRPFQDVFRPQIGRKFAQRLIITERFPVLVSAVISKKHVDDTTYHILWGTSLPIVSKPFQYDAMFDCFSELPPFVFHIWNWKGWYLRASVPIENLSKFLEGCVLTVSKYLEVKKPLLSFAHHCDVYKLLMQTNEKEWTPTLLQTREKYK